jgi:hypothetical protein
MPEVLLVLRSVSLLSKSPTLNQDKKLTLASDRCDLVRNVLFIYDKLSEVCLKSPKHGSENFSQVQYERQDPTNVSEYSYLSSGEIYSETLQTA